MQLLALLLVYATLFSAGNCSESEFCKDPDDVQDSDVCYEILQSLHEALIQDKGNLHRLRRAFFYAPNADPVLLKVKYNITFAENITEEELPYCTSEENSIALNQMENIYGWTSRGLYLWVEPLLLNHVQLMLPFIILRWIHELDYVKSNPEMDAFLWDGSYDLPILLINLSLTSLPCIPPEEMFNSTMEDLTTSVSSCKPQKLLLAIISSIFSCAPGYIGL